MTVKARRHARIVEALEKGAVRTQVELCDLLTHEGYPVTQGTLSRDLADLGVVKAHGGYVLSHRVGVSPPRNQKELERALKEYLVAADVAANLLVLRTSPGHAQALSIELDRNPPDAVVGTIAGDDTIFVATRSDRDARALLADVREIADV